MLFRNSVFCGAGEHNPDNYQLSEKNTEFDKPFLVYSVLFLWLLSDYCSDFICHVTKHNMTDQSIVFIRWEKWVLMKFSIYKPFSVDPRPALVLDFYPYILHQCGLENPEINSDSGHLEKHSHADFFKRRIQSIKPIQIWFFSCLAKLGCAWVIAEFMWILQ